MKREDQLFLLGLVSLVISLFLFPFIAYLFPAVWLGWEYHIPSFVVNTTVWIQTVLNITYSTALDWFFWVISILAIIFGIISYVIAHHISQLQAALEAGQSGIEVQMPAKVSQKAKQSSKEAVLFFLKMVVIIMLVFIVSDVIQWAISFSPPQQ